MSAFETVVPHCGAGSASRCRCVAVLFKHLYVDAFAVSIYRCFYLSTDACIWLHSAPAAQAAKRATTTIPIVIGGSAELIEQGIVASLARPGGNLTGLELRAIELAGGRPGGLSPLPHHGAPSLTRACSRRLTGSTPPSLRLSGAADAFSFGA